MALGPTPVPADTFCAKCRRREGSAFGQDSPLIQFLSLIIIGAAVSLLFVVGIQSIWVSSALWVVVILAVFYFAVPGHAIVYGPVCWLALLPQFCEIFFDRLDAAIRRPRLLVLLAWLVAVALAIGLASVSALVVTVLFRTKPPLLLWMLAGALFLLLAGIAVCARVLKREPDDSSG
jgi:hypothetical protein